MRMRAFPAKARRQRDLLVAVHVTPGTARPGAQVLGSPMAGGNDGWRSSLNVSAAMNEAGLLHSPRAKLSQQSLYSLLESPEIFL